MKYSLTLGLLTVALSPVFADECSDNCTRLHDICSSAPDANQAECAAEYADCLGYNPYDPVFVAPTACASATATATATATVTATATAAPTGGACLDDCQDKYDECINTPGADIPTCDEAVGSCRVSCGPTPPVSPCEQACDDQYDACASGAGSIITVCIEGRFLCKQKCGTTTTTPTPTPTPDNCLADCNKKHDACNSAPGANHATCAAEYSECLGYNPYDPVFVEPTACSKPIKTLTTMPGPKKTISPEVCCVECTKVYTTCCNIPGSNVEVCKTEYVSCLGYNPFDVVPYVEPTHCVIVIDKPQTPPGKPPMPPQPPMPPKDGKPMPPGDNKPMHPTDNKPMPPSDNKPMPPSDNKPMPPKGGSSSSTPDACCVACTKTYTTCCSAAGAVIETCKTEYSTCLGYNPFDVVPYVEPTTCVVVNKPKPSTPAGGNKTPVIVSGGERIQPALALIAMGAAMFICKFMTPLCLDLDDD